MKQQSPDHAEEEFADVLDNAVPLRGYKMLPTVGLGGSAGSIGALQKFLASMPVDTGMAFVVIVHLSPAHDSALAGLLQRSTTMPVTQVVDTSTVEPNHVYVIPPGKSLIAMGSELRLSELVRGPGRHVAVDLFFRTLADTYGPRAIAVVLSGADGDGSIGIRRVKERGGLTIAQDPAEAEHPGMPRSAIATGMVDWILPVAEMAQRIVDFRLMEGRVRLPSEVAPDASSPAPERAAQEAALQEILELLRAAFGEDFARFNRTTLMRRIGRRLQVNRIGELAGYAEWLRGNPTELAALETDLLVSVTNFFRDSDAFEALQTRIPSLFTDKAPHDTVRVWVPACATGEEAYSIAMLLDEHARRLPDPPRLQVFATDISEDAIKTGREGFYVTTIEADVSADRLARFFNKEVGGYRVRRELREIVLFAVHDLLTDAPFARLDMISCRNLLIAFAEPARRQAFDLFHFALRADGKLLLGSSEKVDADSPLFSVLDARYRVYGKTEVHRVPLRVTTGVSSRVRHALLGAAAKALPEAPADALALGAAGAEHPLPTTPASARQAVPRGELHYQLIERFGPPSVIVDRLHEILHMSRQAGRFLRVGGGEPSRNLLQLVDPVLRGELRAALRRVDETGEPVLIPAAQMMLDGQPAHIDISISRADDIAPGCLLVVFAEQPVVRLQELPAEAAARHDGQARELDRELERLKSHLRHTVEQHDASIEELKASNEELQAMNEELRAATEELETSREELQSINEELSTVNTEMKGKVDDILEANSQMHNLMGSIATATVFLDSYLQVTLYTPSAVGLFNFIPADVGRPLADLAQRLDYPELQADANQVLRTLASVDREVRDTQGRWYLARIQPYLTVDDRVAGVVLTFADISAHRAHAAALVEGRTDLETQVRRFDGMLSALPDTVFTLDVDKRFVYAGRGVQQLFGTLSRQVAGRTLGEAGCAIDVATRIEGWIQQVLDTGKVVGGADGQAGKIGVEGRFDFIFAPLLQADGGVEGVVGWSRSGIEIGGPLALTP